MRIIIGMYLILSFIFMMYPGAGLSCDKSENDFNISEVPGETPEMIPVIVEIEPLDCFEYAESVTGFSAEVLRGIAATESHFRTQAVGDSGMSLGMFQLHSRWHESRVEKWGDFDPTDPYESAVIAGRIMEENLSAFDGDLRMAIAAYKQGVTGVNRNGVIDEYVEGVLNWQENPDKMLSFFLFCGITDTEVLQDEYKGTGAQNTYKLNDSLAVQVSWRGSGGIPY
jgi:hypothetical protein